jgi:adenylate cyclase
MTGTSDDAAESLRLARAAAERAIELDSRSDAAHAALGFALGISGQYDRAIKVLGVGRALNPNNANTLVHLAATRLHHPTDPEPARALADAREALRLSPTDPFAWVYEWVIGWAQMQLGDFQAALESFDAARAHPKADWKPALSAAMAVLAVGQTEHGAALLSEARSHKSNLTLAEVLISTPNLHVSPLAALAERLVELGLPR